MSKRRYKVGEHLKYDGIFDALKSKSAILNDRGFAVNFTALQMSDRPGIEGLLRQLVGDEQGKIVDDNGYLTPAAIIAAEEKIKDIEYEFAILKQKHLMEGNAELVRMPVDLEERFFEAEARLDIYLEEADKLKKLLAEIEAKKHTTDDGKVLLYGPVGSIQLRGGIAAVADGQVCKPGKDGIPVITDPRSPYNGMRISDYKEHIVRPWVTERNRLNTERRKKAEAGLVKLEDTKRPFPPLPPWPANVERPTAVEKPMARRK
jgi:hypothetical protein